MIEFRASHSGDLPSLRILWKNCFGDSDRFLDLFFSTAYAPQRTLVLSECGEILGAAYWFDCTMGTGSLAYLYGIGISPSRQNQGLGKALMEAIHAELTRQGYDAAVLVPGEESLRRYYAKFGYRTCSFRRREAAPGRLVPIDAGTYFQLRRQLLPENGVVQEGAAIAFLSALADFYQGKGTLAALSKEDGNCLELLGTAPTGPTEPYAMAASLTESDLPEEIYFAFGFD